MGCHDCLMPWDAWKCHGDVIWVAWGCQVRSGGGCMGSMATRMPCACHEDAMRMPWGGAHTVPFGGMAVTMHAHSPLGCIAVTMHAHNHAGAGQSPCAQSLLIVPLMHVPCLASAISLSGLI